MRREWRNVLVALVLFHFGTAAALAQPEIVPDGSPPGVEAVRLTVEVNWAISQKGADLSNGAVGGGQGVEATEPEIFLELTEGRVVGVIDQAPSGSRLA